MSILAIDPGNEMSAWCAIHTKSRRPWRFEKEPNESLRQRLLALKELRLGGTPTYDAVIIEMVASYGMPVGREVFDTCVWIGRFTELAAPLPVHYVYRMDEKIAICHDSKAKDSNIRQALIDRFAEFDLKNGKGTKANPDFFYGFKADIWAAYAVGTTYLDRKEAGL